MNATTKSPCNSIFTRPLKKRTTFLLVLFFSQLLGAMDLTTNKKELNEQLLKACERNDMKACATLISNGAHVDTSTRNTTPLFTAIENNNTELCEFLLAQGASTNYIHTKGSLFCGYTPLSYAALKGYHTICQLLISNGARIKCDTFRCRPPLTSAARNGESTICALLLDEGAPVDGYDYEEDNPLLAAALNGHSDVCILLIHRGADVNLNKKCHPYNALLATALGGHYDIFILLIKKGAHLELEHQSQSKYLFTAIEGGCQKICQLIFDNGVPATLVDDYNQTPLMMAAKNNDTNICKVLLTNALYLPAEEDVKNRRGRIKTALLIFKRWHLPKELKYSILLANESLKEDTEAILILAGINGKTIPAPFDDMINYWCWQYTLKRLKPTVEAARECTNNQEISDLLNPDAVEEHFGQELYERISVRIATLSAIARAQQQNSEIPSKNIFSTITQGIRTLFKQKSN